MRRFSMSMEEAAEAIGKFGTSVGAMERLSRERRGQGLVERAVPVKTRRLNKKNTQIIKAPSKGELSLREAVVIDNDGFVRRARPGESPVGVVVQRSHRQRAGKSTFYASVAQYVERPSETREVAGANLPGAPDRREMKAALHAAMYGGGSRASERGEDISEFIERRERGETEEGSGDRSEHDGIRSRPEWRREGSQPNWYDAE